MDDPPDAPRAPSALRRRVRDVRSERRARRSTRQLAGRTGLWVHIGAGPARLDGWIDTDVRGAPYYLDLLRPWPQMSGNVSRVFGDNVIEHFRLPEVRLVLEHLYVALEAGGIVRLVTPDVEGSARIYLEGGQLLADTLERHRSAGYDVDHEVDVLRIIFHGSGHDEGYLFDEAALTSELERAGFVDIVRTPAGEPRDAAFDGLEARTSGIDRHIMLAVEATKPS